MLSTGTEIGGYRIEAVLGRGGMGVVYEATQLSLGRTVALKLLAAELGHDDAFRDRFRREARMQARLDHNHIVPVYAAGEVEEGLFIAMRLIRGASLKQLIRARELTPRRVLPILLAVADALDTAHEQGLIHRDVKPQNILVGRRDHAFLADFGLTKGPGDTGFTRTGQLMGTLDYIAPEQIRGEPATAASDVYALSAVAYECLVGVPPFVRASEAAALYAHIADPPPRVSADRPELGHAVDGVIARGLAKAPEERFATALGLVEALAAALPAASNGGPAPVVPAPVPEVRPAEADPEEPTEVVERPAVAADTGESTEVVERPAVAADTGESTEIVQRPVVAAVAASPAAAEEAEPPAPAPVAGRPSSAPAAAATSRRAGSPRPLYAVAAAVAAAVALGAYLLGDATTSSGEPEPAAAPDRVATADLSVQPPAGWRRAAETPGVEGLDLSRDAAVQPRRGTGAVAFGVAPGSGPTLLPAALRDRLGAAPKPSATVRLGRLEAYRYDDLGGARVFVSPSTSGVVTVACTGVARGDCDTIAASLRAGGSLRPQPLGPSDAYGGAVSGVVRKLGRARGDALRSLRAAGRPQGQAAAAAAVAAAYRRAARSLDGIEPTPLEEDLHPVLVARMQAAQRAYDALAQAARARSRSRYADLRGRARSADAAARSAVARLSTLGYEVG